MALVLLDDSFLAFPKLQKMAQAYGIISLLALAGLIGLALFVVLSTHNPDGYFWHPTLRVHFAFRSRIPSFKQRKSRIPKNLLGTLFITLQDLHNLRCFLCGYSEHEN